MNDYLLKPLVRLIEEILKNSYVIHVIGHQEKVLYYNRLTNELYTCIYDEKTNTSTILSNNTIIHKINGIPQGQSVQNPYRILSVIKSNLH